MLWLVSLIWSTLSSLARLLVALGWLHPEKLGPRVVSVGNIQVGGAGKTPLVALIAREAQSRGLSVCILCRGYGGAWEVNGGVISPGEERVDAGLCGDEPALLHELAPHATVAVGADRVRQYRAAEKRAGRPFDLVLLDDGFQHYKIEKDLEIVAVTSATWRDTLFRDRAKALALADLVVWTKGERRPDSKGRPLVKVRFRLPDGSPEQPLWLVTGLADGRAAQASIEQAGFAIGRHLRFPDHARYEETTVQSILDGARQARCTVALTGKDWVKWRSLGVPQSQVRVLEPELVFEEGRDLWQRALWGA